MRERVMWMTGAAAVTLALASAQDRTAPATPALYFFFTPDTPALPELARAARSAGVPLRPVLLVTGFRDWPAPFLQAVADLGELAVVDEEGLALARRFRIARTPAFVWVDARGAHVAYGTKTDLKELTSCGR